MRDINSFRQATRVVKLTIEEPAFTKMVFLVQKFGTEVGWHGFAERTLFGYKISDITVYPQVATEATITTDQDQYERWGSEMPDDKFCRMRLHGHSHVNMGVSPSFVDEKHQQAIISDLCDDDFYIFVIMNKQGEIFIRIFDLAENTVYENDDVMLLTQRDWSWLRKFMIEANDAVETLHVSHFKSEMERIYREDGVKDGHE